MSETPEALREEIAFFVYSFLSDEFGIAVSEITGDTDIIIDLSGDHLLYLEIAMDIKDKYDLIEDLEEIRSMLVFDQDHTVDAVIEKIIACIEGGDQAGSTE